MSRKKLSFDKYKFYEKSVQNAEGEVEFLNEKFQEIRGKSKKPLLFREDFCGTGMVMCEWVKQGPEYEAFGVDLDPEPISYGKTNHLSKLTDKQQSRVSYIEDNVLNVTAPKADIQVAFNFSYQVFKKRNDLKKYFETVRQSIKGDGVFFLDLLGGPDSQTLMIEETEHKNFSYFWDCQEFNPITNECRFAIHFKTKDKKYKNVFVYDWRLWGLPELRDILADAGFSKTIAYWEGDDGDGGGNGKFYATEEAENCQAWVTYLAALP